VRLGRRAVLLASMRLPGPIRRMFWRCRMRRILRYSGYVHQGGSGTMGEALHAGRPMLVVPYGWDQPDNGPAWSGWAWGSRSREINIQRRLQAWRWSGCSGMRALPLEQRRWDLKLQDGKGAVLACDAVESVLGILTPGALPFRA